MARILVVEDHRDVRALLVEFLASEGHDVVEASDGRQALAAVDGVSRQAQAVDLVLLDLMLPLMDGSSVLRSLRGGCDTPVIVVSAKDAVWSKIDLLKLGADDYVTKPFDLGELGARIDSLLRRSVGPAETASELRHGPLVVDPDAALVTLDGVEVSLTATELRILIALMERPGAVLSKARLYEVAWGEPSRGDDATVKAHVSNLRGKLRLAGGDAELVETVWGLGYRLARVG